MDGALQIRLLSPADAAAAMRIERDAYGDQWAHTNFERELQQPVARYIGAFEAGELVGFAGAWIQVDQAHVVSVAVARAQRRRGLGRLLVYALLRVMMAYALSDATLEVRASNEAARALYRGFGFWEVGERKRYYSDTGEDAVIMTTEALDTDGFARALAKQRDRLKRDFPGIALELPVDSLPGFEPPNA